MRQLISSLFWCIGLYFLDLYLVSWFLHLAVKDSILPVRFHCMCIRSTDLSVGVRDTKEHPIKNISYSVIDNIAWAVLCLGDIKNLDFECLNHVYGINWNGEIMVKDADGQSFHSYSLTVSGRMFISMLSFIKSIRVKCCSLSVWIMHVRIAKCDLRLLCLLVATWALPLSHFISLISLFFIPHMYSIYGTILKLCQALNYRKTDIIAPSKYINYIFRKHRSYSVYKHCFKWYSVHKVISI